MGRMLKIWWLTLLCVITSNFRLAIADCVLPSSLTTVNSPADSGPGTLRAAVEWANSHPGRDGIVFDTSINRIYITSGTLTLSDAAGTVISGNGRTVYVDGASATAIFNAFEVDADNNCFQDIEVQNFQGSAFVVHSSSNQFFNVSANQNYFNGLDFVGSGASYNFVQGGVFSDNGENGIRIAGGSYSNTLSSVTVSSNANEGIYIFLGSHDNIIEGGTITDNRENGVFISESAYGNVVRNSTLDGNYSGVFINYSAYNNQVGPGNNIRNSYYVGVALADSGTYGNVVTDNTEISGNRFYNIFINAGATDTRVVNNNISSAGSHGVLIINSPDAYFQGNNINGNQGDGVRVEGDLSDNITLDGNTISGNHLNGVYVSEADRISLKGSSCAIQSNWRSGVYATSSSSGGISNFSVSSCNISFNSSSGVYVENANALNLNGISVTWNILDGVYIVYSSGITLTSVQITGNGGSGLVLQGVQNVNITGGLSDGNSWNGIQVSSGSSNVTISGLSSVSNNVGSNIYCSGSSSFNISSITSIDGATRVPPDQWFGDCAGEGTGICLSSCSGVTVSNISSMNTNFWGIKQENSNSVSISGVSVSGSTAGGIFSSGGSILSVSGSTISGGTYGMWIDRTAGVSVGAGNTFSSNLTGIAIYGASPDVNGNTFSSCSKHCIFISTYYGTDLSPSGASDDIQSSPTITSNTFNGSPSEGAIYAVDSSPQNKSDILTGTSGNTFNTTTPAFLQTWYGILYVIDRTGQPVGSASATLRYTDGEVVSFVTGANGVGAPGRSGADPENILTWGFVKELIMYPDGTVENLQPAQISASKGNQYQVGTYSWDGDTTNDEPMTYALPSTTPGFEGVNQNGRYQAAILVMETNCNVNIRLSGGQTSSWVKPGSPVILQVTDADENLSDTSIDMITAVAKILNNTRDTVIDSVVVELQETQADAGIFFSRSINLLSSCPPRENGICEYSNIGDSDCCLTATGEGGQYLVGEFYGIHDPYPPRDYCSREANVVTNSEIHFCEMSDGKCSDVDTYPAPSSIAILIFDLDKRNSRLNDIKRFDIFVRNQQNREVFRCHGIPLQETSGSFLQGDSQGGDGYYLKWVQAVTSQSIADDLNGGGCDKAVYVEGGFKVCASTQEIGEDYVAKCATIIGQTPCSLAVVDSFGNPSDTYPVTTTMYFRLEDRDENRNTQARDTLRITVRDDKSGDVEFVVLTETGPDTGVFEGEIFVSKYRSEDNVKAGDGIFSANPGDVVTAVFTDPDDNSTCSAEANMVDRGTPSHIRIVDPAGNDLDIVSPSTGFYVELNDPDQNRRTGEPDSVTAVVYTEWKGPGVYQDLEVVKLTETSPSSGIFRSERLNVNFSTPIRGNSTVEASANGVTVAVIYQDPVDITDSSSDVAVMIENLLEVNVKVLKKSVEPPGSVPFIISVRNPNPQPVTSVSIKIDVPPYVGIKGGEVYSGKNTSYTVRRGSPYSFAITGIPPRQEMSYSGYFVVGPQVRSTGVKVKSFAEVSGIKISGVASDGFSLRPDSALDRARIVGSVFIDYDLDGVRDKDEPGIPGVKVCIDKGACSFTDLDGRYHIIDIPVGDEGSEDPFNYERVQVKPDASYLPPGFALFNTRKMITLQPGETKRVSFSAYMEFEPTRVPFKHLTTYIASFSLSPTFQVIEGNVVAGNLLVNGEKIPMPSVDIDLSVREGERYFVFRKKQFDVEPEFRISSYFPERITFYRFVLKNAKGFQVAYVQGNGPPPEKIKWSDLKITGRKIETGQEYRFFIEAFSPHYVGRSSIKSFLILPSPPVKTLEKGVYFEVGEYYLLPEFIKKLRDLAGYLREHPELKIIVEGYTDSTGPAWYNLELSKKRAEMVKRYLVVVEGIDPSRITTKGYGEANPLYPNDTPENRARNRRVEIKTEGGKMLLQLSSFNPSVKVNGKSVPIEPSGYFKANLSPFEGESVRVEFSESSGKLSSFRMKWGTGNITYPQEVEFYPDSGTTVELKIEGSDLRWVFINGAKYMAMEGTQSVSLFIKGKQGRFVILTSFHKALPFKYLLSYRTEPKASKGYRRSNLSLYLPRDKVFSLKVPSLALMGDAPLSATITVDGKPVKLSEDGHFVTVVTFPASLTSSTISIKAYSGNEKVEIKKKIYITHDHFYANGVGYISMGYSLLNGKGNLYRRAKFSIYSYGEFPSGIEYEAAVDTGERKLDRTFQHFVEFYPQDSLSYRFSQAVDVVRSGYPEYGDNAVYEDRTASSGNTYFKFKFKKNVSLLLGGFNTLFTRTELSYYNRALYGLKYSLSGDSLKWIEGVEAQGFLSRENKFYERDEFRSTGGTVYHLRRQNVVEGSEKVIVEVREHVSDIVVDYWILKRNRDYTIDYVSGTVSLFYPLSTIVVSIRPDIFQEGHRIYLIVEYEYLGGGDFHYITGHRLTLKPLKILSTGATIVKDGKYTLAGLDVKLNLNKYLRGVFEFASSRNSVSRVFSSENGGLEFSSFTPDNVPSWKDAWRTEVGTSAFDFDLSIFYRRAEGGFVNGRFNGKALEQYGLRLETPEFPLQGKAYYDYIREGTTVSGRNITNRLDLSGSYNLRALNSGLSFTWVKRNLNDGGYGREAYISPFVRYAFKIDERKLSPYVRGLILLDHRGEKYQGGNSVALGFSSDFFSPVVLSVEGSVGEWGMGGRLSLTYRQGDVQNTYTSYSVYQKERKTNNVFLLGTSYKILPRLKVYGEQRLVSGGGEQKTGRVGINWYAVKGLNVGVYYERGDSRDSTGKLSLRETGGIITTYLREPLNFYLRGELTRDRRPSRLWGWNLEAYGRVKVLKNVYTFVKTSREFYRTSASYDDNVKKTHLAFTGGVAVRDLMGRADILMKTSYIDDLNSDANTDNISVSTKAFLLYTDFASDILNWLGLSFKSGLRKEWDTIELAPGVSSQRILLGPAVYFILPASWEVELDYLLDLRDDGLGRHGLLMEVRKEIVKYFNIAAGYNFSKVEPGDYDVDGFTGHGFYVRLEGYY